MKFRNQIVIMGILHSALGWGAVGSGAGSSGGGDIKPNDFGTAWFPGTRQVRYCYEFDKDFGLSSGVLERTIEDTISIWRNYLKERGFLGLVSMDYKRVPCDGSEDLNFYFGISTEETNKVKATYFSPTAFSHRTKFDHEEYWGKGFVWVAPRGSFSNEGPHRFPKGFPDWSQPNALATQLLHEMGHVLGCDHIEGTIMSQNIVGFLWGDSIAPPTIDYNRMLLSSSRWMKEQKGMIHPVHYEALDRATFKKFVGREPKGQIRSSFRFDVVDGPTYVAYEDDFGRKEIPFIPMLNQLGGSFAATLTASREISFRVLFDHALNLGFLEAAIFYGTVKDAEGNSYVASANLNVNSISESYADLKHYNAGPISVHYFRENKREVLFATRYWELGWY